MAQDQTDVSVIIAAYRAGATLRRAVESALRQQGCRVEVIVIDDASPDGTLELARGMAAADARLRVLAQSQNAGPAAARNRGLDAARGRYAVVLDADDFMETGRLTALCAIAAAEGWDFVADDLNKVPEGHEEGPRNWLLGPQFWPRRALGLAEFVTGNITDEKNPRGEMGFLKPLMSVDFLRRNGLRYREDMRLGEDYALYAEALAAGARFCLTAPEGYIAVVHPQSLSGWHDTAALAALVAADTQLLAGSGLTAAERNALAAHRIDSMKRWAWMRLIDAVKRRDPVEAVACFHVPVPVVRHLLFCLGEQVVLRGGRRFRRTRTHPGAKA